MSQEEHIISFTVQIQAKDKNEACYFRYHFINSDKVKTQNIGAWNVQEDGIHVCEREHAQITVTEELISRLNTNPMLTIFFGSDERPYSEIFELDISPLFTDDVLEQEFPSHQYLKITISLDKPFFTPELKKQYNPLRLTIENITNLPGVSISSKSLSEYIKPTPFRILNEICQPLYVVYQFYDEPRMMRTLGHPQTSKKVKFNAATVVLVSFYSKLKEKLNSSCLIIEVHDRDIYDSTMKQHWNDMATTDTDVFDIDNSVVKEYKAEWMHAGDKFAHGIAKFRLNEVQFSTKFTIKSPVLPTKKRSFPKGGEVDDEVLQSQAERLARLPGSYLEFGTQVKLRVELAEPLIESAVALPLFTRMVFVFEYTNVSMLQNIIKAMDSVNQAALPHVSLRSYQLSPTEIQQAKTGKLDLITGFHIIDTYHRIVVVEGLYDQGMRQLYTATPREAENTSNYRILADLGVRFSKRLYTDFDVDLKKIKLREALPALLKMPEIYMRSKVSAKCFEAMNSLRDIRKGTSLIELQILELFPLPDMLLEIESKYGESITTQDIDGTTKVRKQRSVDGATAVVEIVSAENENARPIVVAERNRRLKAATDSYNPVYLETKKNRREKDYLAEIRKIKKEIRMQYQHKKPPDSDEVVYNYSGQKLQTTEILKAAMRDRLAHDKNANFTYSTQFQSLAMCMVDEDRILREEHERSKMRWTTNRGFVYPAPRPTEEFSRHPCALSNARKEELRQPWIENQYSPQASNITEENNSNKPSFDPIPSRDMIFGGTNGDGTVNDEYFKSVHLVGDAIAAEMEEAKRREISEWENKVVVDRNNLRFLAHGSVCGKSRERPNQIDRQRDILDGPAKSKPLRIVRNAKLPSGKKVSLQSAPITIMTEDEYCEPSSFLKNMRSCNPEKFYAAEDFHLRLPIGARASRSIKPIKDSEKKDQRWINSHSK